MRTLVEWVRSRRSQIAERFASNCPSASCCRFAENVGVLSVVKSELKLREVQRQILPADVVVRADDSAFRQCLESFDNVRVNNAAHVYVIATLTTSWARLLSTIES